MGNKLEQRIARLEKLVLGKRSFGKCNSKFESVVKIDATKFVYYIRSTMTGDNFYFISDDKQKLKSLSNKITDLFLESARCEDDYEHDRLFDQLMNLCYKNNIQYIDDMDETPFMTYAEYLESIGIDPDEDEYDRSLYLEEMVFVDDNNNLYELETIGKYSARF